MRVLVVGAGVIGLTVGVRLSEAGHEVDLLARELPLETTSAVAAALWYPYRVRPYDRVLDWSRRSLERFTDLATAEPDAGIRMRRGSELLSERADDPWWAEAVPALERLDFVPMPYRDGWTFVAPVIEMPVYLEWLHARLEEAGATLTRMALHALPNQAEIVVNCSGLGARALASDDDVRPVRGQVVRVEQIGLDRWLLDGSGLTYVVPRSHDVIVGGTDVEGEWGRRPDSHVAGQIMERAARLVPGLAGAKVLEHRVGLRPARSSVRLEVEQVAPGRRIIHCYGHGGAGVTVSWGCADEVLGLV